MSSGVDLQEFLSGFLAEATEHLDAATKNLADVARAAEKRAPHPRAVRELFRSLHTIKGLASMVGIEPIVDLAHVLETALREADRGGGRLDPGAIDLVHRGIAAVEDRVRALGAGEEVKPAPKALVEALEALQTTAVLQDSESAAGQIRLDEGLKAKLSAAEVAQLVQGARAGRRALRVDFAPSPGRAARGVNITSVRERVGKVAEIVKVSPVSVPATDSAPGGLAFVLLLLTDAADEAVAAAADTTPDALVTVVEPPPAVADEPVPEAPPDPRRAGGFVRVDVARLDDALEKLSSLVVTRFRLGRAVAALQAKGVDVRELQEIVQANARELRDLRSAIMRARMVSVAELLERVPLIVRGLSRSTGKPVRVEIEAGRAELDKAVGDRLFPAIVHLVRNAVDHAIEPVEERRAQGKPDAGLIRVTCFERSNNQLELAISDDGRGIDRAEVARRAGRELPASDAALLELIATPGLSTMDEATHTSGRGLGVDIVRRICVDQLGGELMLATSAGVGTRFTLRVPLTITIVDAFSFACGEEPFVVPVSMVEEIVEVDPGKLVTGPGGKRDGRQVRFFERRGEPVPLVALDHLFGGGARPGPSRKALVVRRNGEPFAFEVDRMLGQQEVVVRPLEDRLVRMPGISGSTDLGDGRPTLVLDLVALSGTLAAGTEAAR